MWVEVHLSVICTNKGVILQMCNNFKLYIRMCMSIWYIREHKCWLFIIQFQTFKILLPPILQVLLWCAGSFEGDGITICISSRVHKWGASPSVCVKKFWASIKFHRCLIIDALCMFLAGGFCKLCELNTHVHMHILPRKHAHVRTYKSALILFIKAA